MFAGSLQKMAQLRLESVITHSAEQLKLGQGPNGAWLDCFDTGVMSDAQTAIALYLLGVVDSEWTDPLLRRIELNQRPNGSWGVYPGDDGDLSTTVECFYALEVYNSWDTSSHARTQAMRFILRRGGPKRCRNLTKVFLAVGGEIPWSWLPSPRLYSWMFAKYSPVHIWDIVMFTRLHIPPMLVLSSLRYVSDVVHEPLLGELLTQAVDRRQPLDRGLIYERIRWQGLSRLTRWQTLPQSTRWQGERLRRCVEFMHSERENDGTAAGYHSSTFLLLLALNALGYRTASSQIQIPLQAMKRNVYRAANTGAAHQQTCNGHIWNTALALHALETAGEDASSRVLKRGVDYLLTKQHQHVGDWILKSCVQPGGWGFSSNNTIHPDTDDTVSCLEALYPVRDTYDGQWWKGVNWLLAMQNRDGGWSAFEKDSHKMWIERLPANDMKRAMTDPSTPDITGRVLHFLVNRQVVSRNDTAVVRAVRWLIEHQEHNGSWFGRWGATYIYGTWCATRALSSVEGPNTILAMQRAKSWVLSVQRLDGGFGEACESDLKGHFIPSCFGVPTQTAWGLDTLVHLLRVEESSAGRTRLLKAADSAADWLIRNSRNGQWQEEVPTGSAFPGALHIRYHIYPKVWPLVALCNYRRAIQETREGR